MMTVIGCIVFQHNLWLVLMAAAICGAGSWAMVRLFLRAASASSTERMAWIVLAAFVTGASIWCVHFVAMLGYEPGLPVSFDPVLTIVSLLVAMAGAGVGFLIASGRQPLSPIAGGLILGLSIAVMHYTGMMAYRVPGVVSWDLSYLIASVVIACGLGAASLHVALRIGREAFRGYAAAALFFLSIVGLHFTGMTAFRVVPMDFGGPYANSEALNALAFAVTCVGLVIVGAGFASSFIDTRARAAATDALANMTNGLVMVSPVGDITLISDSIQNLFSLSDGDLRTGMTLKAYIAVIGRKSGWTDERIEQVFENHQLWMRSDRVTRVEHQFDDGKTLSIACQPVARGGAILTYEDVTEARNGQKTIAHMAHHDALTGLKNRSMFAEIASGLIPGGSASVLVVNLDRFKSVNDRLGHIVGDALLRQVATRLQSSLGKDEHAFRLGSDELAVLTPGAHSRAEELARKIVMAVAAPFQIDEHVIASGCSVGIAAASQDDNVTTLLQKADLALRAAKNGGRARYETYIEGMLEREAQRRALEHDLSQAIERGELELWYQPLVRLPERKLAGFEALIRWRHPSRGLVSPGEFIPLSESSGLIVPIGTWVIAEACRRAADWPDDLYISINVSALQLRSASLASQLAQALKRHDLPASRVEIEITESAMVENSSEIAVVLAGLRTLGVRISMDDFGTGYSSLAHLREFKVDRIKIDRSFIAASGTDAGAAAIVRAVLSMARELRIDTTAEGIEEEEQLERLVELGCGTGQGYLLGRPMEAPVADLIAWADHEPSGIGAAA